MDEIKIILYFMSYDFFSPIGLKMQPQAYTAHCKEELNKSCIFIVKNRA